ncbi:ROK family transcriptional regulator [Zoogloea sp.]|uniref:ROK family transcriptional regulator n=1 Tax=Zoogloea sp. TaxID=49181 RepID=UPI0035B1711F
MHNPRAGRGRNSIRLRRYNERLLLQALRRGGQASKADLARATGLTNTAVGTIIQALEEAGLIEFTGRRAEGQRGQPASLIRLNPKGAFAIGVRLDRDSIETALLDFGGHILARRVHHRVLPPPQEALAIVAADVDAVLATLGDSERRRLTGIGVAQPYNLGAWLRELDMAEAHFHDWDDYDFAYELGEASGLPVFSENDGNAAAIAELFHGCGQDRDDFLYIFLGPVIGCGIALDGDCLRGTQGNAGDIAVMPVPAGRLASSPRPAGAWDLLLSRASLHALARHLRHWGAAAESLDDLAECVRQRHPAVEEWLDDCVDALAPVLRASLCLLDLPAVVVDADIDAGLVDALIQRLRRALAANAPEARGVPELVRGSFGSDAGAIGAASLPLFFNFSPRTEILRRDAHRSEEMHHEQ